MGVLFFTVIIEGNDFRNLENSKNKDDGISDKTYNISFISLEIVQRPTLHRVVWVRFLRG